MVFASELARCRIFKRISNILLVISVLAFLWMLFTAPSNIKTDIDYVYEYATKRLNYTYDTVDLAFKNNLQYKFPNYDVFIRDEIEFIKSHGIINHFYVTNVQKGTAENEFVVRGREMQLWCDQNTGKCEIKEMGDKVYNVRKIKGKFQLVENNMQIQK
jgi:hypothetical protein